MRVSFAVRAMIVSLALSALAGCNILGGLFDQAPIAAFIVTLLSGAPVGKSVGLDASSSMDPQGYQLSYHWGLKTPSGSNAVLTGSTSAKASFTPDIAGTYTVSLDVAANSPADKSASASKNISIGTAAAGYSVSYDGNGSSGGSAPAQSSGFQSGDVISVSGNAGNLVKDGYAFIGWNTAADGTGTSYAAGDQLTFVNASVLLYAHWAAAILTVAGNGTESYGGDGGQATAAMLDTPYDVSVDTSGNLYIADYYNSVVRKVSPSGIITTVAGTGSYGYGGDSGPATSAQLERPSSVAIDSAGNLYIADYSGYRIRKVDTSGTITTFAGDGTYATLAPRGMAIDDAAGALYVADYDHYRVQKIDLSNGATTTVAGNGTLSCSTGGQPATSVSIGEPTDVALDSNGNLYIADDWCGVVWKVDTSQNMTIFAGGGTYGNVGDGGPATSADVGTPEGLAVDAADNLYIANPEYHAQRIRRVDAVTQTITTVAGNGTFGFSGDGEPAVEASLGDPYGMTVDPSGILYIADADNERVRRVQLP